MKRTGGRVEEPADGPGRAAATISAAAPRVGRRAASPRIRRRRVDQDDGRRRPAPTPNQPTGTRSTRPECRAIHAAEHREKAAQRQLPEPAR